MKRCKRREREERKINGKFIQTREAKEVKKGVGERERQREREREQKKRENIEN